MVYNLTNVTAANSTLDLVVAVNDMSGNWWANLLLVGLFLIVTINVAIKTGEALKGMVAGSFLASVVGMLLLGAGIIGKWQILICVIGTTALVLTMYAGGIDK